MRQGIHIQQVDVLGWNYVCHWRL